MSHDDHDSRLTKLETTVNNLASSVSTLADSINKDREKLWSAVEQVGQRGRITWPAIFAAVTVFLGVLGYGSKVMQAFIDQSATNAARVEDLREAYAKRDLERIEARLEKLSGK